MRASTNTIHLTATDSRIAPWDGELDLKAVGTGKVATGGPQGRDMSHPYRTKGATRGKVHWFHHDLSERYWG